MESCRNDFKYKYIDDGYDDTQNKLSKFELEVLTGEQMPNKQYYDPRKLAREGKLTFKKD